MHSREQPLGRDREPVDDVDGEPERQDRHEPLQHRVPDLAHAVPRPAGARVCRAPPRAATASLMIRAAHECEFDAPPRPACCWPACSPSLLLGAAPAAAARDRDYLPPEVEQALKRRKVPGTSLSVFVREVGRDEPLVSYNSSVPRNPASTMKVRHDVRGARDRSARPTRGAPAPTRPARFATRCSRATWCWWAAAIRS